MIKKAINLKKMFTLSGALLFGTAIIFAQDATPPAAAPEVPKRGVDMHGQISTYLITTMGVLTPGGESQTKSVIANGLLPASLSVLPYWEQGNLKVTGNFTAYVSLNSFAGYDATISNRSTGGSNEGGDASALQTNFVEFMQAFAQITHKKYGTFLLGRDFGMFSRDAAFNDIAVLGVGVTRAVSTPKQVHDLGLGYGYNFCDKYPQINYTTPSLGGLNIAVGLYQPLNQNQSGGSLGFQAKANFAKDINASSNFYISTSIISQKIIAAVNNGGTAVSAFGWEAFAKLKLGGFALSTQFNTGSGIGYYGLFVGGTKQDGGKIVTVNSSGYYVQGAYSFPKGFTAAVNYGSSKIDAGGFYGASDGTATARFTVSVSQPIGPFLMRAEYTNMSKSIMLGVVEPRNIIAIGGTFLF